MYILYKKNIMKTLIFCILSFLMISCSVPTWNKPNELLEEEHPHGIDTHIHEEDEWNLLNSTGGNVSSTYEPVIPISDFWESVEGSTQINEYDLSLSGSIIKVHWSLYLSSGSLLWDAEILYGYNLWDSFQEVWKVKSSTEGQYYFKSTISNTAQNFFYIDIKIWEIVSRIYFVPNNFDANIFVKQYDNLPSNMYFATVVMLDDDIITGVDILANPS